MDDVIHTCINPTMKVTAMAICSFTDSVLSLQVSENCSTVWLVRLPTGVTELVTLTHVVMMCTFGDFRPFSMAEPIIRHATANVPTVIKKKFLYLYIHVEAYSFHFINGVFPFNPYLLEDQKPLSKKIFLLWKYHKLNNFYTYNINTCINYYINIIIFVDFPNIPYIR